MTVYLVPLGQGRTIPIDKAVLLFGRHPDCDIVLTNSRKVSRKHCCVAVVNNKIFVRDLGSMNGVRVNGEKVKNLAPVKLGDELAIGDVFFKLMNDPKLAPSKNPAAQSGSKPPGAVRQPVIRSPLPHDISQSRPVVIPDPGGGEQSFIVEASQMDEPVSPKKKVADWEFDGIPTDDDQDAISLEDSEYDIRLADEKSLGAPPQPPANRKPPRPEESDVIMLDDESDDFIMLD